MEELSSTNSLLKAALDNHEKHLSDQLADLDSRESSLTERINKLNKTKADTANGNGNVDASPDDLIEINAGGKQIVAKRSSLTQLKDTMLEALFSGRWEKRLQRDKNGRIFLDVNSTCFQAIVDYLNEMTISSEDNPPDCPSVDDENKHILQTQMELFGLCGSGVDSKIVKDRDHVTLLHEWLGEEDQDGELHLLYRYTRDRKKDSAFHGDFHSKCNDKECTIVIIETTCGTTLGGYTNSPWTSDQDGYSKADKAFLFVLEGSTAPRKLKLMNKQDSQAIYNEATYGPAFGGAHDLYVQGKYVFPQLCGHTYESCPTQKLLEGEGYKIKEMEVFQIVSKSKEEVKKRISLQKPDAMLSKAVSDAIDAKRACLLQAEMEVLHLEDSWEDERAFINNFVTGETKDVISLNVSGTIMTTKRCVLRVAEDSVLAQQFDDTKWTEQGSKGAKSVKEWTPDEVADWATKIDDVKEDVGSMLKENEVTGVELLALTIEGLKMMGIKKIGTLCLIQKEIKELEQDSNELTLIEHSPYCFGKILDYFRLIELHSQGLMSEEPALPKVQETQKRRFDKVVQYYFPGESSKYILGESKIRPRRWSDCS